MTNKWWETECPICNESNTVAAVMRVHEDNIVGCSACEFQWNTALPEHEIIILARDHIRKEQT